MHIRGAPLIAIVAVSGLAVDLTSTTKSITELNTSNDAKDYIYTKMEYLKSLRPIAVNLFNAMKELRGIVQDTSTEEVVNAIVTHAQFMLKRDVSDNKDIGTHSFGGLNTSRRSNNFNSSHHSNTNNYNNSSSINGGRIHWPLQLFLLFLEVFVVCCLLFAVCCFSLAWSNPRQQQ